jgi:hypothetical protein
MRLMDWTGNYGRLPCFSEMSDEYGMNLVIHHACDQPFFIFLVSDTEP